MIWANDKRYIIEPFEREGDLEAAVLEVQKAKNLNEVF